MRIRVLGIVLAGGKGTRLAPLTNERAKPAVPFGGKYRIIDFVLSNFINSGIYSIDRKSTRLNSSPTRRSSDLERGWPHLPMNGPNRPSLLEASTGLSTSC